MSYLLKTRTFWKSSIRLLHKSNKIT